MDEREREHATRFFGGELPPGFEYELTEMKRFLHGQNLSGSMTGGNLKIFLMLLYWQWREFWPKRQYRVEPVVEPIPVNKEHQQEVVADAQEDEEVQVVTEVTWDNIEDGHRVAAFYNGRVIYGIYKGMAGDRVKVSFQGDEKNYRLLSPGDIDINGRE